MPYIVTSPTEQPGSMSEGPDRTDLTTADSINTSWRNFIAFREGDRSAFRRHHLHPTGGLTHNCTRSFRPPVIRLHIRAVRTRRLQSFATLTLPPILLFSLPLFLRRLPSSVMVSLVSLNSCTAFQRSTKHVFLLTIRAS